MIDQVQRTQYRDIEPYASIQRIYIVPHVGVEWLGLCPKTVL